MTASEGVLRKTLSWIFGLCAMVLAVIGCAAGSAHYDYDRKIDFSGLKTFAWHSVKADVDPVYVDRFKDMANARLRDKGLQITSDIPDVVIAMTISEKVQLDLGSSRGLGTGRLVLEFINPETKSVMWRGESTERVRLDASDPGRTNATIRKFVRNVLKGFPPVGPK